MSEPVSERIMVKLRTRVAATFAAFRSTRVAKWQPKDSVTHVFQLGIIVNPDISCPGNPPAQGWTLQAAVAAIAKPSDKDLTAIDTYKNRLGANVIAAITNAALWHNWDGLAINSDLGEIEDYSGSDGASQGVTVKLDIHFRTDENNLYVARG